MDKAQNKNATIRTCTGGYYMAIHKNRDLYSKSPSWPIVPYRLTKLDEADRKKMKIDYDIGLEKEIVLGWTLSVSEETKNPIMVSERPLDGHEPSKLNQVQTKLFYNALSTICGKLRKEIGSEYCDNQDICIIKELFQITDEALENSKTACFTKNLFDLFCDSHNSIKMPVKNNISVKKVDVEDGRFYFEYNCPLIGMTELIFPVIYEGMLIAFVVSGQIIDDIDVVKTKVNELLIKYNIRNNYITQNDWKKAKSIKKSSIVEKILNRIKDLEALYGNTVSNVQHQMHYDLLKMIIESEKKIARQPSHTSEDSSVLAKKVGQQLDSGLILLRNNVGIKNIWLYWNEWLESEISDTTGYYSNWKQSHDIGGEEWFPTIDNNMVDFLSKGNVKNEIKLEKLPSIDNKDNWSVFMYRPTMEPDIAPIIIGIEYVNKKFYHQTQKVEMAWENVVLPKYALFIHNATATFLANRRAINLNDNRALLEHEVGQVADGVRHLTHRYNKYIASVKNDLEKSHKNQPYYNQLESQLREFVKRTDLYCDDILGQFHIVELVSKTIPEAVEPSPELFDMYQRFMNKWNFCFNAACFKKNNELQYTYWQFGDKARDMSTDPWMLEHSLYNVVNNAIEYCYKNTIINIDIQHEPGYGHIFKISNYGIHEIKKENQTIYDRGVRGLQPSSNQIIKYTPKRSDLARGRGLGLYWTKKFIESLDGSIEHDSVQISKYNVPLLSDYFNTYNHYTSNQIDAHDLDKLYWDKFAVELAPYDEIKKEKKALEDSGDYNKIVVKNMLNDRQMKPTGFITIINDIDKPTYKVTFTIKVPYLPYFQEVKK